MMTDAELNSIEREMGKNPLGTAIVSIDRLLAEVRILRAELEAAERRAAESEVKVKELLAKIVEMRQDEIDRGIDRDLEEMI